MLHLNEVWTISPYYYILYMFITLHFPLLGKTKVNYTQLVALHEKYGDSKVIQT